MSDTPRTDKEEQLVVIDNGTYEQYSTYKPKSGYGRHRNNLPLLCINEWYLMKNGGEQ